MQNIELTGTGWSSEVHIVTLVHLKGTNRQHTPLVTAATLSTRTDSRHASTSVHVRPFEQHLRHHDVGALKLRLIQVFAGHQVACVVSRVAAARGGVQLAVREELAAQVDQHALERAALHAVHCRRPGQHGGELLAQDLHRHVVYLHVVVVAAEREFRRLGAGGVLEAHVDDVLVARGHRREHAFDGAVVAVDVGHEPHRCAHLHRDQVVSARTRLQAAKYTSCRVRSRAKWCGGGMLQIYTQAAELMHSSPEIDVNHLGPCSMCAMTTAPKVYNKLANCTELRASLA